MWMKRSPAAGGESGAFIFRLCGHAHAWFMVASEFVELLARILRSAGRGASGYLQGGPIELAAPVLLSFSWLVVLVRLFPPWCRSQAPSSTVRPLSLPHSCSALYLHVLHDWGARPTLSAAPDWGSCAGLAVHRRGSLTRSGRCALVDGWRFGDGWSCERKRLQGRGMLIEASRAFSKLSGLKA